MAEGTNGDESVELLQQLGLKEYEARAFVALNRVDAGTAKDIAELSEVPRTRVYDAIRVLETKGLVEIQHTNPQVFRAVSIDEAADTLQREYDARTDSLRESLRGVTPASGDGETELTHEVWSLSGDAAISTRTNQLVEEAEDEIVLVVGHAGIIDDEVITALSAARERGVAVIIGAADESVKDRMQDALPAAEVFVSGLDWLRSTIVTGDETEISRLLLVDRNTILVSTFREREAEGRTHEQAVFGRGFDNGLVVIMRRLMSLGLLPANDPGTEAA
jgi:sugar-specific transcriptional regulator TrmB